MTLAPPTLRERVVERYLDVISTVELGVSVLVFAGVIMIGVLSVRVLTGMDWSQSSTFDEFVSRVMIVIIGLEVIRLLLIHDLGAVVELVAFAVARKMLKADVTAIEIALGALALVGLMAAKRYFQQRSGRPGAPRSESRPSAPGDPMREQPAAP